LFQKQGPPGHDGLPGLAGPRGERGMGGDQGLPGPPGGTGFMVITILHYQPDHFRYHLTLCMLGKVSSAYCFHFMQYSQNQFVL
jgi:hypothetical protein